MGLVQSKKDGVMRRYQLQIDIQAPIKKDLLELANQSFKNIKQIYGSHCRKGDCPFIDFFTFHKILPYSTNISKNIFQSFGEGDKYINIFQFITVMILISHNSYRKKLQFLFVLFDFEHNEYLKNRQIILIFQSFVNGFCRLTGQQRPKYDYLNRYTVERFIRVNTLEALQKIVNYRRLIEQVQGNNDAFDLFKRFDQEIYSFFNQESYLFRVDQYKRYSKTEIEMMHRIIKKVNKDKNFEEVELVEKNRRFRLQNRKVQCVRDLLQEKEQKFKTNRTSTLKTRSSSLAMISSATLPSLKQINSKALFNKDIQTMKKSISYKSKVPTNKKILILNGKVTNREGIFQIIQYFKNLSRNKNQIKLKQFFKSFQKKAFLKKQISSLFKFFDKSKCGQISFEDFLRAYYQNITQSQIDIINEWYGEYKQIHEADNFDFGQFSKKKEKKTHMQLPKSTLQRIDEIFNSIDIGKKGYLVMQDLKKAYCTGFTIKELQDMLKTFGKDNKIYKQEFIVMTLPEEWTIEGTDYVGV